MPGTRQRSQDRRQDPGERSGRFEVLARMRGPAPDQDEDQDWAWRLLEEIGELAERLQVPPEAIASAWERVVVAALEQGRSVSEARGRLVDVLLDGLDLRGSVPQPVVDQAHKVAARRRRLVEEGAWSVADLAAVREVTAGAVHTWLGRQRDADRLFTVSSGRETYVPALLLDEAAEPYEGLDEVIGPLKHAGMDPWALWVWLDTPSGWLDGQRPADLIPEGQVERVARAAADKSATAAARSAEPAA